MRRKLKDTGGLTFVEMLCAVCILVLLVLMMNTCLNMAVKTYQDITAVSEAELLVSSLSDALADKLRYCVVTEKKDAAGTVTARKIFITQDCVIDEDSAPVPVTAVTVDAAGHVTVDGKRLLPDGAYGEDRAYIGTYAVGLNGTAPLVAYDPGTNCFNVSFTVTAAKAGISKTAEFTVRCLNPVKKEV